MNGNPDVNDAAQALLELRGDNPHHLNRPLHLQ